MLVSLCMIAFNEEDALDGLFDDIRLQDYPHEEIEVVFVDSMSTDGTQDKMEQFKENGYGFKDVKIVQCEKKNQAFSWNTALMTATGELIIRVDAHARIPKNFVSRNVYNISQGEDVVGGGRPNISPDASSWKLTLLAGIELCDVEISLGKLVNTEAHCHRIKAAFGGLYDYGMALFVGKHIVKAEERNVFLTFSE